MTRPDDRYRVGVDIGGTFTDFVLVDGETGRVRLYKCLTTPKDPSAGALEGLEELLRAAGLGFADLGALVHGTTLVTNAIIERSGSPLGLLTTRGFRDVLEMGTEQRYDIYDLFLRFPEPLAPRAFRREVDERLDRDGRVVMPLDLGQARREVAGLVSEGVEALAVCFLHAYRNPVHERAVAEMVRREFPGLFVSLSSEVVPELREYERSATTAANAYVQPLMARYVAKLEGALAERGFAGRFYLIQSSGGMTSPATARRFPIRLLESGPAGGALVTAFFGRQVGQDDVIAFDMGGTTAKACLVQDGRPDVAPAMEAARVHRFKRGSGLPIKAPVIDMIEIGAGGGSIAHVDALGLLKVGPRSAGADPGPACYGLGGRSRPSPTRISSSAISIPDSSSAAACASSGRPPRSRWPRSPVGSDSTPSRRHGASTRSCARTWRRRRGCTSSRRAATRVATRWWPSVARARRTRRASPGSWASARSSCRPRRGPPRRWGSWWRRSASSSSPRSRVCLASSISGRSIASSTTSRRRGARSSRRPGWRRPTSPSRGAPRCAFSVRSTTSPCRSRRVPSGMRTSRPSRPPSLPSTRASTPTCTRAPSSRRSTGASSPPGRPPRWTSPVRTAWCRERPRGRATVPRTSRNPGASSRRRCTTGTPWPRAKP